MTFIYSQLLFIQIAFYATVITFVYQRSHLLISLLCLEGIILCLVLYLPILIFSSNMPLPTIRIIILTFGACEASLGLRIMVLISRSYGSDMIKSLSTNKC